MTDKYNHTNDLQYPKMTETERLFKDTKLALDTAERFYLLWFNDYLTTGKIAEHFMMSPESAGFLIDLGKRIHDRKDKS